MKKRSVFGDVINLVLTIIGLWVIVMLIAKLLR